jgi:hypothetical protein
MVLLLGHRDFPPAEATDLYFERVNQQTKTKSLAIELPLKTIFFPSQIENKQQQQQERDEIR